MKKLLYIIFGVVMLYVSYLSSAIEFKMYKSSGVVKFTDKEGRLVKRIDLGKVIKPSKILIGDRYFESEYEIYTTFVVSSSSKYGVLIERHTNVVVHNQEFFDYVGPEGYYEGAGEVNTEVSLYDEFGNFSLRSIIKVV